MFGLIPIRSRRDNRHQPGELMDTFNDFFIDDFFTPFTRKFNTDIQETKEAYVVDSELPGFEKSDITVNFVVNYLTICATHIETDERTKDHYISRERQTGKLVRRF